MTQRNTIAPGQGAKARVAALHQLCDQDYGKGQAEQAAALPFLPYTPFVTAAEPSDLATAIRVAQKMLAAYSDTGSFGEFGYAQAHGALSESLRILLHALGAESSCPNCGRTFEDCTCAGTQPGGGQ